jgi:hypothetical protein
VFRSPLSPKIWLQSPSKPQKPYDFSQNITVKVRAATITREVDEQQSALQVFINF